MHVHNTHIHTRTHVGELSTLQEVHFVSLRDSHTHREKVREGKNRNPFKCQDFYHGLNLDIEHVRLSILGRSHDPESTMPVTVISVLAIFTHSYHFISFFLLQCCKQLGYVANSKERCESINWETFLTLHTTMDISCFIYVKTFHAKN